MEIKVEPDEGESIFQVVPYDGYYSKQPEEEDVKPDINQLKNQAGLSHEMTFSVENGSQNLPGNQQNIPDTTPEERQSESRDSQRQEDENAHQQEEVAGCNDAVAEENTKGVKRKLAESELCLSKLQNVIEQQKCSIETLEGEVAERRIAQADAERLVTSLYKILGEYGYVIVDMEEIIEETIPYSHPGKLWKHEETIRWFKVAKKKWNKARTKLEKLQPEVTEVVNRSNAQN